MTSQEIDQYLTDVYTRAYTITQAAMGGGSYELVIQVAKDIKEMEERQKKVEDKSDFGGVMDKEEEDQRKKEAKREKEEEDAWGELDLGLPQEANKKAKVKEDK